MDRGSWLTLQIGASDDRSNPLLGERIRCITLHAGEGPGVLGGHGSRLLAQWVALVVERGLSGGSEVEGSQQGSHAPPLAGGGGGQPNGCGVRISIRAPGGGVPATWSGGREQASRRLPSHPRQYTRRYEGPDDSSCHPCWPAREVVLPHPR